MVALLQIPAIGLSQFVVEGTGTDDLAKGPGHYSGTAAPGQAGNVAIAGHRTTHGAPFYNISALKPGDTIYLTDLAAQRLTYIVAFPPYPVDPSNVSVLNYFGDNRLTLTSCNPPYSAAQRLIVVAGFKGGPGAGNSLKHTLDAGKPYDVALQRGGGVEHRSLADRPGRDRAARPARAHQPSLGEDPRARIEVADLGADLGRGDLSPLLLSLQLPPRRRLNRSSVKG